MYSTTCHYVLRCRYSGRALPGAEARRTIAITIIIIIIIIRYYVNVVVAEVAIVELGQNKLPMRQNQLSMINKSVRKAPPLQPPRLRPPECGTKTLPKRRTPTKEGRGGLQKFSSLYLNSVGSNDKTTWTSPKQ